jgi:hypothetical protein
MAKFAPHYILSRAKLFGLNPPKELAEALEKFPELRARAQQQDRDYSEGVASLMEPESAHAKLSRWGHSWVAMFDFATAVPTALAAYDMAITEGIPQKLGGTGERMSEEDAIRYANSMVREAHGTNIEAGRANLMNSRSEAMKLVTTLHNFMNNTAGQQLDMLDKLRTGNFSRGALTMRYMASMIAPALVASWVAGEWDKSQSEEEPWYKWAAGAIGEEYAGTVPLVRDMYSLAFKGYTSSGLPPWMKMWADVTKPARDAAKGTDAKHPIKDWGNGLGYFVPGASQAGATAQFLHDVGTGEADPQTFDDWAQGFMHGHVAK